MNGLKQIQKTIEDFICEKKQIQQQIVEIEKKRTQLAEERNQEKKNNEKSIEVGKFGKQITELGNRSQELQNELDFKFHAIKSQVNISVDNYIAEGIRKIRKINEEVQEIEAKMYSYEERTAKYEIQRQEFYERFGRMPELSENAIIESKKQEEESKQNSIEIQGLKEQIKALESEITELARIKREFKNGNWNLIINKEQEICIQEVYVEEIQSIEELYVEEIEPIEEMYVEEFAPIEELNIEEINVEEFCEEEYQNAQIDVIEKQVNTDEIEELAKLIVEEIAAEQTAELNIQKSVENDEEDIIVFEEKNVEEEKITIPLFGQKATISNINIKFDDKNLLYIAKMSDGHEIKFDASKLARESVLLRDKKNREECEEILVNYAISEYRVFDKKVINKIDPLVCELLIECANKYNYNAQELIYNYAMSFSEQYGFDAERVPAITYNLSFIDKSGLNKKEKAIIKKICKGARKNNNIEIIQSVTGLKKIKYIFKRIFAINNINVLPEAKY